MPGVNQNNVAVGIDHDTIPGALDVLVSETENGVVVTQTSGLITKIVASLQAATSVGFVESDAK